MSERDSLLAQAESLFPPHLLTHTSSNPQNVCYNLLAISKQMKGLLLIIALVQWCSCVDSYIMIGMWNVAPHMTIHKTNLNYMLSFQSVCVENLLTVTVRELMGGKV